MARRMDCIGPLLGTRADSFDRSLSTCTLPPGGREAGRKDSNDGGKDKKDAVRVPPVGVNGAGLCVP